MADTQSERKNIASHQAYTGRCDRGGTGAFASDQELDLSERHDYWTRGTESRRECFDFSRSEPVLGSRRIQASQLDMYATDTKLFVFDRYMGLQIAEHDISLIPGKKITKREHYMNNGKGTK